MSVVTVMGLSPPRVMVTPANPVPDSVMRPARVKVIGMRVAVKSWTLRLAPET